MAIITIFNGLRIIACVGHLENARYSPNAYILYKTAKVLKVEISDFYPNS